MLEADGATRSALPEGDSGEGAICPARIYRFT